MPHSNVSPQTRKRSKELRKNLTLGEKRMWDLLRQFNRQGARFRRETPIGPYIADFAWLSRKLVVEVDGDHHGLPEQRQHDENRDGFLASQGFKVLRFESADMLESVEGAYLLINNEMQSFSQKDPIHA